MSQSSLEQQFKDAGIKVQRGVKVVKETGLKRDQAKTNSGIWLYRWAKNSYINFPVVSIANGIRDLADLGKGLPAIIVGVGPSLDDQMAALREAVGRAVIISTDAAFRPLMANGIRPDLMISYDCKSEQKLLWESVPHHDVPGLFDSCAHPQTIQSWNGPVLFYNHYHQADELSHLILPHVYPSIGQIPSGATVGNTALLASKIMGCSPAIVVGFDFCYKQEGRAWRYRAKDYKYLVDSTDFAGHWIEDEIKVLYDNDFRVQRSFMKDFKGTAYRMDPELEYYHEIFLSFVTHFKVETINTSLFGALAEAVATFSLESAVARFCPIRLGPTSPLFERLRDISDVRV